MHGGDSNEQRYSTLTQINADNVAQLGLAWAADMPEKGQWQATPLMVDGVPVCDHAVELPLRLSTRRPARSLWKYSPQVPREIGATSCAAATQNRGATYWNGKIIWATLDGRLVAVDAKNGKLVWETATSIPWTMPCPSPARRASAMAWCSSARAGGEYHQRGFMSAYDAETGK